MSTDGPGLYQSDDAADIRNEYRDHLGNGLSGAEATNRILSGWADYFREYPESERIAWLALADTQWRLGHLEERVKRRAIDILDSGQALRDWAGFPAPKRREKVLLDLRTRLDEVQPRARTPRRPFRDPTPDTVGDLLSYRRRSGRYALLQVVGIMEVGPEESQPTAVVLDHDEPYAFEDLEHLPGPRSTVSHLAHLNDPLCMIRRGPRDVPPGELAVIGNRAVDRQRTLPCVVTAWRDLDERLEDFGLL